MAVVAGQAPDLFGAGVIGSQSEQRSLSLVAGSLVQKPGNPEIEEHGLARQIHQNVGRLEVPMDHETSVRIGDGVTDLTEESADLIAVEMPGFAPNVNGRALDILHDEVRDTLFGSTAIDQTGDIGVVEVGQDLALPQEAIDGGSLRAFTT